MTSAGLLREGPFVVLSGPALRTTLQGQLIAIRQRRMSGLSTDQFEAVAAELRAAMSAAGHSDVRLPAVCDSVPVEQPTVPVAEAAVRMKLSVRQATRRAPGLGGKKIAGRWFVDATALDQHIGGTR